MPFPHFLLLVAAATLVAGPTPAAEPIRLFDGKSLDGWVDESGKPVTSGWRVVDGELFCPGHVGSVFTANEFGDFELTFRWRIAARGNSGVKYRVRHYERATRGKPGLLGLEYQLADAPGPSKHATGALYELCAPAEYENLRRPGEYNESRIVAVGNHLEHWLNGQKVVEVDLSSDAWAKQLRASKFASVHDVFMNRRGRIMLQDHGAKVWFSEVIVRPLNAPSGNQELPTRSDAYNDGYRGNTRAYDALLLGYEHTWRL